MIIIPDAMRRPAEVERDELKRQLAEAQADADHWKGECNALQRMVHEARAEIERKNEELDMFLAEQQAMNEIIERKDKLIEQLKLALKTLRKYPHTYKMTGQGCIVTDKDLEQCDAALLAAERGEGL